MALFVGQDDTAVYPGDSKWTRQQIGEALVLYEEVNGGHLNFFIA